MRFRIIAVGRLKDRAMQQRCDEFVKWLGPYAKTDLVELADATVEKENAAILRALSKEDGFKIVLSEDGVELSSEAFAARLSAIDRKVILVIGGPGGLAPEVKRRADLVWSLSRLTFTHEIARLLVCEQLFRAVSILHGGKYHIAGALP